MNMFKCHLQKWLNLIDMLDFCTFSRICVLILNFVIVLVVISKKLTTLVNHSYEIILLYLLVIILQVDGITVIYCLVYC